MPGRDEGSGSSAISVLVYDEEAVEEEKLNDMGAALDLIGRRKVTWIMVQGTLQGRDLDLLRERLGLHPVMVDEVSERVPMRPKLIDLQELVLITWKLLRMDGPAIEESRAMGLLGRGVLITVVPPQQEFRKTLGALRSERDPIRKMGADYLLYDIMDSVIDDYYSLSEELGNLIDEAQDRVLESAGRERLMEVQELRRALTKVRKAIWPLREAFNSLVKGRSDLVDEYSVPYFRDAYDHTIELMETVDTHRDMLSEMLDIYQSEVSNQLNQVVKVLTIISVVFAPLTFIVGLYGMNFRHMPELDVGWGYPMVLAAMLVIAAAMLLLFHRKRWF